MPRPSCAIGFRRRAQTRRESVSLAAFGGRAAVSRQMMVAVSHVAHGHCMAATAIGLDEAALLGLAGAVECVHSSPRYPPPGLPEEKNSVFSELAHEFLPAYLISRELAAND